MSLDQKQMQTLIHKILVSMGYKVRPKAEVVEIASLFGIQIPGTKDTLLDSISEVIAESINQFRGYNFQDVPMECLLQGNRTQHLSQKVKSLLINIFKQIKKEIRKQFSRNTYNMANPIVVPQPHNNSMYSFNPTFQNYNIMYPFMQHKYPFPYYPFPPSFGPFDNTHTPMPPFGIMGQMGQLAPVTQPTISQVNMSHPSMGHTSFMQPTAIQPRITQPNTSQPVTAKSTIKQPTEIKPSISQLSVTRAQPAQKLPSPSPVQTNPRAAYSKQMPFIIESKPKAGTVQKVNLDRKFIQCICCGRGDGQSFECRLCSKPYHVQCLKMTEWSAIQTQNFECPSCAVKRLDPLNQVKTVFMEQIINFGNRLTFSYTVRAQREVQLLKYDNYCIQMRSIRLDGKTPYMVSWPDCATFNIADKVVEFKPLLNHSSMKKRKDEAINVDKSTMLKKGYFNIRMELKPPTRDLQRIFRVREEGMYLVGVYLVKKVTVANMLQNLNTRCDVSMETSKEKIAVHFKDQDIALEKLCMKLTDPISLDRITVPGRGIFCRHPQCFSLDTFVLMMSKLQNRVWKCPICNYRCYDLYKDPYLSEIVNGIESNIVEVEFNARGQYKLIAQEPEEGTSGFVQQTVAKKLELIIDDDQPEIISVNSACKPVIPNEPEPQPEIPNEILEACIDQNGVI